MKIKRILIFDRKLEGVELTEENIPIFKKGGMLNEFNIETKYNKQNGRGQRD